MRVILIVSLAAAMAMSCGPGKTKAPGKPTSKPTATAAGGADAGVAAKPARSCTGAVEEFLLSLPIGSRARVRDDLVGRCADEEWPQSLRHCLADADSPTAAMSNCKVTVSLPEDEDVGDALGVGIAICDRLVASYRKCAHRSFRPAEYQATMEALAETMRAIRRGTKSSGGRGRARRMCEDLATAMRPAMSDYGCRL